MMIPWIEKNIERIYELGVTRIMLTICGFPIHGKLLVPKIANWEDLLYYCFDAQNIFKIVFSITNHFGLLKKMMEVCTAAAVIFRPVILANDLKFFLGITMSRKQSLMFIDKRSRPLRIFFSHLYVEFFRSHYKWTQARVIW